MKQIIFLLDLLFSLYYLLILGRVILSFFPETRLQVRFKYVYGLTEPLLQFIRKGLPPNKIGIDASPFLAIILLWIVQRLITSFLA